MEHGDEDAGRWRELFRLLRFHLEEKIDNNKAINNALTKFPLLRLSRLYFPKREKFAVTSVKLATEIQPHVVRYRGDK